jgi:hypothetical protein
MYTVHSARISASCATAFLKCFVSFAQFHQRIVKIMDLSVGLIVILPRFLQPNVQKFPAVFHYQLCDSFRGSVVG